MPKTSIEWTDYSWPVVNGCRRKSAGCGTGRDGGCYAERLAATRLRHIDRYRGLAVMTDKGPQWTGEYRLVKKELSMPLRLRKPSRIFVADMGDLFFEAVPDEVIAAIFGVMAACPQHRFQVLTKRPERALEWFECPNGAPSTEAVVIAAARALRNAGVPHVREALSRASNGGWRSWPLDNVDIGVSVEDQATADERIPLLLQCPAAVRRVSYEPALGPVDFAPWLDPVGACEGCDDPGPTGAADCPTCPLGRAVAVDADFDEATGHHPYRTLDWIVVGGESGPGARPFDLAWARSTIRQCREAGTACFVKQLGARPVEMRPWPEGTSDSHGPITAPCEMPLRLRNRKGADPSEWPEDLRVREMPEDRHD